MVQDCIDVYETAPLRLAPPSLVTSTSTSGGIPTLYNAKFIKDAGCEPAPLMIRYTIDLLHAGIDFRLDRRRIRGFVLQLRRGH
jgi:hypothetical protein